MPLPRSANEKQPQQHHQLLAHPSLHHPRHCRRADPDHPDSPWLPSLLDQISDRNVVKNDEAGKTMWSHLVERASGTRRGSRTAFLRRAAVDVAVPTAPDNSIDAQTLRFLLA